MKFFHRGKPKNDGIRVCTNIRIIHIEEMQSIISDVWQELEAQEIALGLQRFQHHDLIKIGHILRMMDKINLQE